jgi:putative phosphoesterase
MRAADLVIHAGDLSAVSILEDLRSLGPPVAAVHGNVDSAELMRLLPERQVVDAAGVRIGLVHDAGPATGRLQRMRLAFADCAAVVFGHSHIPLHEEQDGFQIFNPGSPTDRRRQPRHSMGVAVVCDGRVSFEHVWLD